jgi:hypothetical protein
LAPVTPHLICATSRRSGCPSRSSMRWSRRRAEQIARLEAVFEPAA